MTLALPNIGASTPIFDSMLATLDEVDAHFMSVPVDTAYVVTAPVVIDGDIVSIVDTNPEPVSAPGEPDVADDYIPSGPVGTEAWLWILAFGVVLGAVIWLVTPSAPAVW
ncbi:hypothetical protein M1M07_07495 [Rhodococcus sp. HM1]|uniref:hypothetical protein n=1 Tax=Rhodococcus sp. HM1 TaxID=2937759 RepID=UPI00200B55F3|nr:hypothetical protein [Rhodococcus sp. HM1]MCK8670960.1 hypothetical protein [Rhodococcus sp. HM1]